MISMSNQDSPPSVVKTRRQEERNNRRDKKEKQLEEISRKPQNGSLLARSVENRPIYTELNRIK